MRKAIKIDFLLLAGWAGLGAIDAWAEETCWARGSGQFFDGIKYCVSSARQRTAAQSFGPDNFLSGANSGKGWCAGAGAGIGETVTIRVYNGSPFKSLLIGNGIAAGEGDAVPASRIKELEISTDTGVKTSVTLADLTLLQSVALPVTAKHSTLTLTILGIYPGRDGASPCLNYLTPDFEELDREAESPKKP